MKDITKLLSLGTNKLTIIIMAPTGEDGLTGKWNGPYKVKKKIGPINFDRCPM